MLFGRDADEMTNLHPKRDRSSSFHLTQIEDDYETEPLISTKQFYKRIRGKKGAFPPTKRPGNKGKKGYTEKTPVYACAQVNELTTIDTKSNTFTVRLSLMLILDIDVAETTERLKEEYEECLTDPDRSLMIQERQRKMQQWDEIIENAIEDGTPYKIEDEEYQLFEEEIDWPESLELFNKITEDQTEAPKFSILRTFPAEAKEPEDVKTATVWIEFMEGLFECKEYQELEFFPFDLQDLSLDFQLTTRTDIDRFDFRLHTVEFYRPCLQMAEWTMYPPESDRKGTAKTSVRLRATRKARYYITNIVGMMCILNCMCIAAFGIEVPDIADRLSVTMTMMLTAVAFKFIVGDQLPKVSYNTYLDFYLLYTMGFMFMVSVYFCAGPHIWKRWFNLEDIGGDPGEEVVTDVKNADRIICYILSSVFVMFTGYWFTGAYLVTKEINEELPPPINLEEGIEYISYRWQQVPFIGFENPITEQQTAGKGLLNRPDPENIDRLLSLSTKESYEIEPLGGESEHRSFIADSENLQAETESGFESEAQLDFKLGEPERKNTGGDSTDRLVSPDHQNDAASPSVSTFEIEAGTLPAGLSDKAVSPPMEITVQSPEPKRGDSKRGPETPSM